MKEGKLEQTRSKLEQILNIHKPNYLDSTFQELLPNFCKGFLFSEKWVKWIKIVLLGTLILLGVKYYYEEMQGKVREFLLICFSWTKSIKEQLIPYFLRVFFRIALYICLATCVTLSDRLKIVISVQILKMCHDLKILAPRSLRKNSHTVQRQLSLVMPLKIGQQFRLTIYKVL